MDNRVYWIWLQNAFGAGSPKPVQLVRRIGSAEKLYQGGTRLWSSFSFVSDKELAALNAYGVEQAAAALEYYLKLGQKVITPDDEDYPVLLKEIYNPPAVLYVQGDLSILSDAVSISIVGTRKASQNGLNAAREIAYGLALKNAVVISGGALGIDSEAHQGCTERPRQDNRNFAVRARISVSYGQRHFGAARSSISAVHLSRNIPCTRLCSAARFRCATG